MGNLLQNNSDKYNVIHVGSGLVINRLDEKYNYGYDNNSTNSKEKEIKRYVTGTYHLAVLNVVKQWLNMPSYGKLPIVLNNNVAEFISIREFVDAQTSHQTQS